MSPLSIIRGLPRQFEKKKKKLVHFFDSLALSKYIYIYIQKKKILVYVGGHMTYTGHPCFVTINS
jgi:hypothetical protein